MKSIIYILLAVLLSGIVLAALPKTFSKQQQVITIQNVDNNSNNNLLNESCAILKNRLKDYGLQSFDVTLNVVQNSIDITIGDKIDANEILPLLLQKGKIEFYETYDRSDVVKLIDKDNQLNTLLNIPSIAADINQPKAILGYCSLQNKTQVDAYITNHYVSKLDQGIKFLWSDRPNKEGLYVLYLLNQKAALDKTQILETSVVAQPNKTDRAELMINFDKNGAQIWQCLSRNNIGKEIAFVLDNVVFCAPTVRSEISHGKCMISGDFSIKEVTRLNSLIKNHVLPLAFELKK
jgi:preprotein translocase subunit SecD